MTRAAIILANEAAAEGGPTWAWVAALALSVVGVLVAALAAVFLRALGDKIDGVHGDLQALKERLDRGDAKFGAIEAQIAADRLGSERRLTALETRLSIGLDEMRRAAQGGKTG
ncbi:MAG: hypothetical protein IBJ10_01270 [Phycisphaerales bacterium]|nr:hypothetical protein [Phycisphaerales bacterium]